MLGTVAIAPPASKVQRSYRSLSQPVTSCPALSSIGTITVPMYPR
jgi:hypothetical protein